MRTHLRTLLVIAATAGLLLLFLRQANLLEVWHEIERASPGYLGLALVATAFTYVFRAIRWRTMLAPVGHARFSTAFRTTVIGFAANGLLPARPGEVLRPFLLARREGLSATSAFATILVERLLDLVTVLLLFGLFVLLEDQSTTSADPTLYRTVQVGGLLAMITSLLGLGFFFLLAGHPERLGQWSRRAERFLPARAAHWLAYLVERFAGGFAVMRHPGALVRACLLSFPLWLSICAGIWFVSRAFRIDMGFVGTFLMVALLTVGVAVPTPGSVGGFHYAYRIGATAFFAAPNERAVGAAIVLHAISFFPVTLVGLIFMLRDGLSVSRLGELAAGASRLQDRAAGPPSATDPELPIPGEGRIKA